MQTPNELLPDGLQMDLLWTNASPASAFASQDITINDYGKYKYLMIDLTPFSDEYGEKSKNGALTVLNIFNDNNWYYFDRNSDAVRFRYVKWNNNVISFSSGYYNSDGQNEMFCVPIKIYGVK